MAIEVKSYLDEARPDLQSVRIIAHPDLQEVSNRPCDTGTPLDVLREEFPVIQFPDALFPESYPRAPVSVPSKEGTVFDDVPQLLNERAQHIREYIKGQLDETEIILISHGSFVHFLLNWWAREPGKSRSFSTQLQLGQARPFTLPGKNLPGLEFEPLVSYAGPGYPLGSKLQDFKDEIALRGKRDCGIFTVESVKNA
jgi:hypothetical protein